MEYMLPIVTGIAAGLGLYYGTALVFYIRLYKRLTKGRRR